MCVVIFIIYHCHECLPIIHNYYFYIIGYPDAAIALLNGEGINVNVSDNVGKPLLLIAVEKNYTAVINILVQIPELAPNARDKTGNHPLIVAIEKGYIDAAVVLCQCKGIDTNVMNKSETPALVFATRIGNLGKFRYFFIFVPLNFSQSINFRPC